MSNTMVKVDNMVDLNDDRISTIIKNLESILIILKEVIAK